jgi:transposase
VRRIDELFAIERAINRKPPDERRAARQERSERRVVTLEAYMREHLRRLSPKSKIAKPIRNGVPLGVLHPLPRRSKGLSLKQCGGTGAPLCGCGARQLDLRRLRRRRSSRSGDLFPRPDLPPQRRRSAAWLADVLARLPDHPAKRIGELTPWVWHARRDAEARLPTVRRKPLPHQAHHGCVLDAYDEGTRLAASSGVASTRRLVGKKANDDPTKFGLVARLAFPDR